MADPILVAKNRDVECHLLPALANRHGLVTGATGTGKTVTLQTIAEQLSKQGVAVFLADVKGDLTGISQAGTLPPKVAALVKERGLPEPESRACPVTIWDVFGVQGHPVRATVSDMGPLLLARMLALNETQSGVLNIVFKVADDNGLAAARSEGSARDAAARRRQRARVHHRVRQRERGFDRRDPARAAPARRARAATGSSASRCSRSRTSSRPSTGAAW